jgi:hypothetical protein
MHGNIQITTKFYSVNSKVTEQMEGYSTGKGNSIKTGLREVVHEGETE